MRILRSSTAFALVLTLATLVLLTVLVLAFFSRATTAREVTYSSTSMAKTDYLARASLDFITSELRQEITDRSTRLDGGNATFAPVFQPLSKADIRPAKMGITAADVHGLDTLLKVSAGGLAVRPAGERLASSILISTPSLNGRYISWDRWFGSGGPGLGSQPGLPSWFYFTRDNGPHTPEYASARDRSNADFVVGRFAYTVYDVSGLLDANIAGYPTSAAAESAAKTSTAHADLTALDPAFTSSKVDSFVAWRNGLGDTAAGSSGSPTPYQNFLTSFAMPRGFLDTKLGHNTFLSRRDLLNGVNYGLLPAETTPLLTHHSRTENSPSWGPDLNSADIPNQAGGPGTTPMAYKDEANSAATANRYLPNVRQPAEATVNRYGDDGTLTEIEVQAGDRVVQKRFSLAKLAWLTRSGPAPGISADAIEACFGLRWSPNTNVAGAASNARWEYVARTSSSPRSIKTLDQVAQERREPNFFELLKAGILQGSLGRDPGIVTNYNDLPYTDNTRTIEGPGGLSFEAYSADRDRQVLQIGANVIDQSDADSYPTAIYFPAFSERGAPYGTTDQIFNTLYGIENLPYLHRLWVVRYEDPKTSDLSKIDEQDIKFWLQPELWNLHQAPTAAVARPTHFRLRAYGGVQAFWYHTSRGSARGSSLYADVDQVDFDSENPPNRDVYFADNGGISSPFYARPKALKLVDVDTAIQATSPINLYAPSIDYTKFSAYSSGTPNEYAGIFLMSIPYYRDRNNALPKNTAATPPIPNNQPWYEYNINSGVEGLPHYTLTLEYWDGANWNPYTTMSRIRHSIGGNLIVGGTANPSHSSGRWDKYEAAIKLNDRALAHSPDPRTDRFSVTQRRDNGWTPENSAMPATSTTGLSSGSPVEDIFPWRTSGFHYSPDAIGEDTMGNSLYLATWLYNQPNNPTKSSSTSGNAYYADPDGVVRAGDGARWDLKTGDGCYLIHGTGTNSGTNSAIRRRPIVLDRPFRSVGELGHVYRDLPGKNLDLWTASSADSALLDLFCLSDSAAVIAGQVNLNSAHPAVLKALLTGATTMDAPVNAAAYATATKTHSKLSPANAQSIADAVATYVRDPSKRPLSNRADLANELGIGNGDTVNSVLPAALNSATNATWIDRANKAAAETPVRALANVMETKSWNLLIDVVVQSGRLAPIGSPTGDESRLKDFVAEGEKRYWLHLTIDRLTGKVIAQQLEPVL